MQKFVEKLNNQRRGKGSHCRQPEANKQVHVPLYFACVLAESQDKQSQEAYREIEA